MRGQREGLNGCKQKELELDGCVKTAMTEEKEDR